MGKILILFIFFSYSVAYSNQKDGGSAVYHPTNSCPIGDNDCISYRDSLFSETYSYNMFSSPTHDEDNAIYGVKMFYCSGVADILNHPFQAKLLYEKGSVYIEKYVESISKFSLDYNTPDILDFYKPRYIKDKNILIGMILQDTLDKVQADTPVMYSSNKEYLKDLKVFYTDN